MDRPRQIQNLEASLTQLVAILRHDQRCQWTHHFESCLSLTQHLASTGFTQANLNELSHAVMSVYGGMGTFNDYAPLMYDQESGRCSFIAGTEEFDEVANQVYEKAQALRVIGDVL